MANFKLTRKEANDLLDWIDHPSMSPDAVLTMASTMLHGHSVESCRDERAWVDAYYGNTIALYVNRGDTYATTLLYDTEMKKFRIISWGDWFETWNNEQELDGEMNDRVIIPKLREIDTMIDEAFQGVGYNIIDSTIDAVEPDGHDFVMMFENGGYVVSVSIEITSPKE
jgi:hypothetical protein